MSKRILIMGLPGSGKTTLAEVLQKTLQCPWFNADKVREQFNDWDFSVEGRIRQAQRMRDLVDNCPNDHEFVIVDFVAPLTLMREIYDADFTVWVDTIQEGRFDDTNKAFTAPEKYDLRVTTQDAQFWAQEILKKLLPL
jgi:adenylylsulfate kinase